MAKSEKIASGEWELRRERKEIEWGGIVVVLVIVLIFASQCS